MEQFKSSAGQGLGIVGLVLGILAIIFGIIPCTFILGLVFGIIGIIFGSVAYTQAQKAGGSTSLPLGALTVSIVGTCVALFLLTFTFSNKNFTYRKIRNKIQNIEEKSKDLENLDKAFDGFNDEMENVLKELEDSSEININIDVDIDKALKDLSQEEKAEKLGKSAGKALKVFLKELNDTTSK